MKEKQPSVSRSEKMKPVKKLNRVTSRSYGIAAFTGEDEKKVCNMLFQNEELPTEKEDVFYTRYDHQTQAALEVFESIDAQKYKEIARLPCWENVVFISMAIFRNIRRSL